MANMGKSASFSEYTSEFNMTLFDMQRMDKILTRVDTYSILCGAELKFRYLLPYLNTLKAFYRYIRPLLKKEYYTDYDKRFNQLEKRMLRGELDYNVYKEVEKLHEDLLESRQRLNLGLFVTKKKEIAEKYIKEEYRT